MIVRCSAAIAAVLALGVPAAAQEATVFTITNESPTVLVSLMAREPGAAEWEYELLESEVASGDTTSIQMEMAACFYELLATFDDGDTEDQGGMDLCALNEASFSITDYDDTPGGSQPVE